MRTLLLVVSSCSLACSFIFTRPSHRPHGADVARRARAGAPYSDVADFVTRFRQTPKRRRDDDEDDDEKRKLKNDDEWAFFDTARINVKAGNGGDGCVAMRRERGVDMGGPSGGNGGRGGSIRMVCNAGLNTLTMLRRSVCGSWCAVIVLVQSVLNMR